MQNLRKELIPKVDNIENYGKHKDQSADSVENNGEELVLFADINRFDVLFV